MLHPETPYPNPGSYALHVDQDEPGAAIELARILRRGVSVVTIALPLRDGASGTRTVPFADLIDATPLTACEAREFHDLDRHLAGREPRNLSKAQRIRKARRDALYQRIVHGPILDRLLRFMRAGQQRRAA